MKKTKKFFPLFLLALTTMPFSTFADLPEDDFFISWMEDNFCSTYDADIQVNCDANPVFRCGSYVQDFSSKKELFASANQLLKKACNENKSSLLANIKHIQVLQNKITHVFCATGYMHPTTGSKDDFNFRCIKDPDYSERVKDSTPTATSPAPKPAASKAGGATQKKVATPPKPATNTHTQTTPESTAKLREPWKEYEAHEAEQPINTDAYTEYNEGDDVQPEKTKKGLCTNAKEHHLLAKYVDGVCTVESCVVGYELVDNTCVKKEKPAKTEPEENSDAKQKKGLCTNAKEHHLLAKYVDGVCTVESCVVGYEVSEDKKSCVKKDNSAKAESKLEKELEKDINTLTKEFLSVVKSITKTCEKSGGSITDGGECVVPETTESKDSKPKGRSAGAKAKKGKK